MKKFILFLLLIICNYSYSQQFELTADGFVNSENKEIDYIILEYPGKSKEELFKDVLVFANKNFKSAKDVISKVEYDAITINARSSKLIRRNNLHAFNNNYTFVMSFKDGKIRINAPIVELVTFSNGEKQILHISHVKTDLNGANLSIYNKKGIVKSKMAETDLNDFAVGFLNLLKSEINTSEDW
ncbi:DUF4468 domain-containing protein [Flavobacterium sp. HSC-61S13]|uniref:DUF4468 domain-containing protein n=1 Tax=Flavobacterium sp. HSC-61S13 TaxID=2910963 RepID=UPI0020A05879|nr:DUF4468 domain-containing protein [Flavobacterium sp. HSC-61S13]MCP1997284.1 hypothetical protein [Flavobacterium sp. HSC-61S13]